MLSLIPHDMMYGPQAALIAESFTGRLRYSGASLGYQLASIIAGGPAPLIAAWLFGTYHTPYAIAWYIAACAVISLIATALMPDYTGKDIDRGVLGRDRAVARRRVLLAEVRQHRLPRRRECVPLAASGSGGMVTASRRSNPTSAASTSSSTSITPGIALMSRPGLPDFGARRSGEHRLHVDALGPISFCSDCDSISTIGLGGAVDAERNLRRKRRARTRC